MCVFFCFIAQQEAERARFLVEKVSRNTCQWLCTWIYEALQGMWFYFKGKYDTFLINLRQQIATIKGNFGKKVREEVELSIGRKGKKCNVQGIKEPCYSCPSPKVSQVTSVLISQLDSVWYNVHVDMFSCKPCLRANPSRIVVGLVDSRSFAWLMGRWQFFYGHVCYLFPSKGIKGEVR